jgi:hypothetical protein
VSQKSTNRYFDDLARAMAEGSLSRRGALKLIAGTAIAALIPSRALADDDCVRVCHVPFDRDTEECDFASAVTRCVSRRERRRHLENHPCDCRGRCANCLTPTCQPVGGTCSADDQCCIRDPDPLRGNCVSGTCVQFCNSVGECTGGAGCVCLETLAGHFFCGTEGGSNAPCGPFLGDCTNPGEVCGGPFGTAGSLTGRCIAPC